jgi:TPR repeat protein
MADIAHDASGPVSATPGDIAAQQTSRSDASDKGKLRVFISYSRDDLDFADQLDAALKACGFECILDRHGISGGEDWKRRLGNLISEADTVVFVLSPTSARSEICAWEVEEATRLGKRILPVNCQSLKGASPPPQLRERNYIFFHADPKAAPGAGFGTGLAKLVAALNTDFDWLREHTRYLQRATEWNSGGRPANRLLSGDDIAEAKAWVARRPKTAPDLTALHLDFIRASEEEAEVRSSAQRKQLEAMAAAQADRETALHQAEEAQRKRATMARIRNIALVAVSILALLAGWLGWRAEQQRKIAEEQRAVAEDQREQADHILRGAKNIFVKLQKQMDIDTQKEVFAVFQRGARSSAASMFILGGLYADGFGVVQDYAKAREWYEKAAEWYEKAADKGDAMAMFNLGILYDRGFGVAQDYGKAREWYEKAADKGNAGAMNNLGWLYANGFGVAQDYAKAREWYEKAADKGAAMAMTNLERLSIKEAAEAGRYAEALELQEAKAAKVETAETKRGGQPGEETAQELKDVAWYALFAREFTKALTASDRAHAFLSDDLGIETNRAHALMFVGRAEHSKALYLAHKGKPVSQRDARLWEHVIAEDFAEFRKAGLTHPMMADIEKELGVSP